MKKLSLVLSTVIIIAVMVVNLRVENKNSNISNLALANIHLLTANAEEGGTGCSLGCQSSSNYSDYCFNCSCSGSFYQISIGDHGTC